MLFRLALATTLSLSTLPAWASLDLAKKHACTACHAVDKKLVGPAYQAVAKKYEAEKDAPALLARSIRDGGSGKWGPVPMPAQPQLSDADVKALAAWIQAGAK